MVPIKQIDKPLNIEMQYGLDAIALSSIPSPVLNTSPNCPKLDLFEQSKPLYTNSMQDLNNLTKTFLQLYNVQVKNDKALEMYNAVRNGQFISLKTYVTVLSNLDFLDQQKELIKETIEIYGKCPQCGVQFITINECTYCPKCYLETTNISAKDTSSTNGVDKFKSTYLYKRVSHYINKLDKLTACENTKIPTEVIDMIFKETKKEHRNINSITVDRIKYYLSKYNYSKYSDNVNQIYKIITGKQRIYIPPLIYNMLINNFTLIDQVLSQLTEQEGNFNNFLNYSYLHYKICEHLKLKKYQYLFPLCKSQDKIYAHDNIWKTICKKIGWTFIPTI